MADHDVRAPTSGSRVGQPGYRRGVAPGNKGRKWPARPLTQEEVALLFEALPAHTLLGKRNRAMLSLMYRAEVKIGRLLTLMVADYDQDEGTLVLGRGRLAQLDPTARRNLDEWLEARKALALPGTKPMFCTVSAPNPGNTLYSAYVREMLSDAAVRAGVQKRVNPESLRVSRREHREDEAGRFEQTIAAYVNAEAFRIAYPEASRKWLDAHRLLETSPERLATQIGHLCREAIQAFSDALVQRHGVGPFEANKTKTKIRAVFATRDTSEGVRKALLALTAYWESVSDLVQRQEHGPVGAEDSRRVVFLTMFVMREIDLALGAK
jgi:hypothetical protein